VADRLGLVKLLIEESIPYISESPALEQYNAIKWIMRFDRETEIVIEWSEDLSRLILISLLGRIPEDRCESAFRMMLSYNLAWQKNGGAKMGISGELNEAIIALDLYAETLSRHQFCEAVEKFLDSIGSWKKYLSDGGEHKAPAIGFFSGMFSMTDIDRY
jgi:hypothetical protein